MEKKLTFSKLEDKYFILVDSTDVRIEINDLKIDSQDIYDKIYFDLPIDDNNVCIKIVTNLTEKEDLIIYKQLSSLFKQIDEAINLQISTTNN